MTLASLLLVSLLQPSEELTFAPTDDVWVYSHAGDNTDPYLRIWGAESKSVAPTASEVEEFGYSYLRFNLSSLQGKEIESAELILTHKEKPAFTQEASKNWPLEARPLSGIFDEASWIFDKVAQVSPVADKDSILGTGFAESIPASGVFKISLNLKPAKVAPSAAFCLALTSRISPQELGQGAIYKVFSKDAAQAEYRPVLKIVVKK